MSDRRTNQTDDAAKQRVYRFHRFFPWIVAFVSISAVVLIVAHIIWPSKAIDSTTVALLIVVILPWILPFIRSVELPGGTKIELSDLEVAGSLFLRNEDSEAASGAEAAGEMPAYLSVGLSDPNLALAGLRIELERMLGTAFGGRLSRPTSNSAAIERLRRRGLLSELEASALQRMLQLLNRAVHGAEVEADAAAWALTDGPRIVAQLGSRLDAIETEYQIEDEAREVFKNAGARITINASTNDFPPMVAKLGEHRIAFEAVALAEDFRLRQAVVHINTLIDSDNATEGMVVTNIETKLPKRYEGIPIINIADLPDYISGLQREDDRLPRSAP